MKMMAILNVFGALGNVPEGLEKIIGEQNQRKN